MDHDAARIRLVSISQQFKPLAQIANQRVAKVSATLRFVEDHIARVLDEIKNPAAATRRDGAQTLHGPRLDIDAGHASQGEIDALFDAPLRKSNKSGRRMAAKQSSAAAANAATNASAARSEARSAT